MKGRHEKREFFMNGIGMPLKLGIAEGELENHVHLGVGAISQEKWESKRSCQNQMKKGEKRLRSGLEYRDASDAAAAAAAASRERNRGKSMKTAKPQEYRIPDSRPAARSSGDYRSGKKVEVSPILIG